MALRRGCMNLGLGATLLALALACGREGDEASAGAPGLAAGAGDSRVVARLNGEPITIGDLQASFGGALRADARHALDAAVARRLVAEEARRRGLDANPAVQAQLVAMRREASAREDAVLRNALQTALEADISVSEDELRAYYEQAKVRFSEPRLRLRRVVFPSAEAARAEDERLGADGRLDPATSEEIGPTPVEKLMRTGTPGLMRLHEPGQRIVVEREGGFALVELVERLAPAPLPFEEVREQIETQLRSQRAGEAFAKRVEELRAEARLEIDEAALQDDAAWPKPGEAAGPLRRPHF